jgi:hypothetical protein
MAKRPEEQLAEMIGNLPAKTGKTLDQWLDVIRTAGLQKHREIRIFLQESHSVGYGYANQIALRAVHGDPTQSDTDPADEIYVGPKEALRPIHDALMEAILNFGSDVDVAPKKGYVSLRRNKQFAMIQLSTATRVDLGINLRGVEPSAHMNRADA